MPLAAPNALQQTAALKQLITQRAADGVVNLRDVQDILRLARKDNVQNGELQELRRVALGGTVTERAKDFFVPRVDQLVPAGAPTAQLAAILFRLEPATGRQQLLALLDRAKNPVAGGPKTFVITGLGRPYLAAITTGQVISGLTKFLDGATEAEATKIRGYLRQQLRTLELPISRGGLKVPGMTSGGLAMSVDTRAGGHIAVNQSAIVLRALEKVAELPGPQNAALAAEANRVAGRVAKELKADLDFCYPATGRLAYSVKMEGGRPIAPRLEDGDHLKTTLIALKSMERFGPMFRDVVKRTEVRLPEISMASPDDLNGASGRIYTDAYNAFRAEAAKVMADGAVTAAELQRLEALSKRDGLVTSGERGLIRRAKQL